MMYSVSSPCISSGTRRDASLSRCREELCTPTGRLDSETGTAAEQQSTHHKQYISAKQIQDIPVSICRTFVVARPRVQSIYRAGR